MRVQRYPGQWAVKIIRVGDEHRHAAIQIAAALGVSADSALRLALRFYVRARGLDLPQWRMVIPCTRAPLMASEQIEPKLWIRIRPQWPALVAPISPDQDGRYQGGLSATVRAAIVELHAAGPGEWARIRNMPPDEPLPPTAAKKSRGKK